MLLDLMTFQFHAFAIHLNWVHSSPLNKHTTRGPVLQGTQHHCDKLLDGPMLFAEWSPTRHGKQIFIYCLLSTTASEQPNISSAHTLPYRSQTHSPPTPSPPKPFTSLSLPLYHLPLFLSLSYKILPCFVFFAACLGVYLLRSRGVLPAIFPCCHGHSCSDLTAPLDRGLLSCLNPTLPALTIQL